VCQLTLTAPFPWFGGKSRAADLVWRHLGAVGGYVEPFAGSLGVLLGRPTEHAGTETVNDIDGYVVNFWRAVRHDPEAVAAYCDWPVTELDLTARHSWLVNNGAERLGALQSDADWFDARIAGWWVWGCCAWIGSGWCSGQGPWTPDALRHRQLPHLGTRAWASTDSFRTSGTRAGASTDSFRTSGTRAGASTGSFRTSGTRAWANGCIPSANDSGTSGSPAATGHGSSPPQLPALAGRPSGFSSTRRTT
jgi:hypothetical protein